LNDDKKQKFLKVLQDAEKEKQTGSITVHLSQGGITQIERREIVK
jgi:hypothetical protein